MPRPVLALAALALAASASLGGCSARTEGAVSLRWVVYDQTTGLRARPNCSYQNAAAGIQVQIDTVEVLIAPHRDMGTSLETCDGCRFGCSIGEGTSPFVIPSGVYSFAVRATGCGVPVGLLPPPVVRAVRPGEIVNLDAVAILLPPCERSPCFDGGTLPLCSGSSPPP